jgi:hypothetical protein
MPMLVDGRVGHELGAAHWMLVPRKRYKNTAVV